MAGSQRQRDLAEHIAENWRTYGFDAVEMPEYKVPLSLPQENNPNKVEVVVNGTIAHTITGKIKVGGLLEINNYHGLFLDSTYMQKNKTKQNKTKQTSNSLHLKISVCVLRTALCTLYCMNDGLSNARRREVYKGFNTA